MRQRVLIDNDIMDPETHEAPSEQDKRDYGKRFRRNLRSTILTMLVIAALAAVFSAAFLPVLQVTEAFGCISAEKIIGETRFRIWPLTRIGPVT